MPDYNEQGPKLVISGVVYKADGKTAAKDVIMYIYHTDQEDSIPINTMKKTGRVNTVISKAG
ncbi:MAG: hypothetical protein WDO19_32475 [Bacteroidota bacterium]